MSKADVIFKEMCENIINNGFSSEGYEVRPKWADGVSAHTKKVFGVVNRYNLAEEFPAITFRKTYIKNSMDEILWIWQRKSNSIHDLKSHVWDEWADEKGTIGKAYGYQQAKRYPYKGITEEGLKNAFPDIQEALYCEDGFGQFYNAFGYGVHEVKNIFGSSDSGCFLDHSIAIQDGEFTYMTQIDKAIYDLVNHPLSRRIIVTMWNPSDLHEMALEPCAYSMTFNVTGKKLNAILNQRSSDVLAAGNWNVCQYALLLMMIAQVTGYEPGELVHVIADCHIYDRHIPIIKELIERPMYPAPVVRLNPEIKNFYDFTPNDITIENYQAGEQVKNIPIAI